MKLDELQKILDDHAKWLKGDGGKKADLSGSNLRGSDLSGSNLRGSDLSGSDLSGSDLSGSDLSLANLRGSDLSGSDLSGSKLRGSNLSGSKLRGSDLSGSDLTRSNLRGSDLSGSDLTRSNLSGSDLSGVRNLYLLPVQDPRGYSWPHAVQCDDGVWRIRAGCRFFTIAEARKHWGLSYTGERRTGDMYLAAIDWLERVIAEDAAITKAQGGEG